MRSARLILIEKSLHYELVDVDFSSGKMPADHLARHPFGKVPVLQHGDFSLYETTAIGRYLDAAFPDPALQPPDHGALARMAQVIAILDTYVSAEIRKHFVYERLFKPMLDLPVDQANADRSAQQIVAGFRALAALLPGTSCLVADQLTLADLHLVPLFDYLAMTPGGDELIQSQAALEQWWSAIRQRDSVQQTAVDLTIFNPQWRHFLAT